MNKFLALTKVLLKSTGEALIQKDKKKLPKTIAFLVLMAAGFLPMVALFVSMAAASYSSLVQMNQEGYILVIGVSAASLIVFIFGIFYVMSTFYFSLDIEKLLPLPLKPSTILGAKFTVVVIYEYLTELLLLLPIMITFGVMSKAGIVYYLYSIIIFLTLPIVPLVFAAFISMIIMRFTPFAKNKDVFNIIAGIFGLFIAVGLNLVFQGMGANGKNPEQMMLLLTQGNNSMINTMSNMIPSAKLAVNALVFSGDVKGLVNILLYLIVTIALLLILFVLGEALYFKGVIGITQSASKRKKLSKEEFEENTTQSSAIKSYLLKELKLLVRTPAYFMNCVIINFFLPVILLIPIFSQPDLTKALDTVKNVINAENLPGYIIAAALGLIMFISVTNPTACTSISREGENIFVCKYLPISYKKQLLAKALSAILLNSIGLGLIIVIAMLILIPPVYVLLQIIVLAVLINIFDAFLGILVDLSFPKLHWDTEQRAVKQNMNVLIVMLLGVVIGGLTIFAIIALGFNIWISFGILAILFGLLDILLYWLICTYGVSTFKKLQG
jgi:ABC-2 type transport system permease protein